MAPNKRVQRQRVEAGDAHARVGVAGAPVEGFGESPLGQQGCQLQDAGRRRAVLFEQPLELLGVLLRDVVALIAFLVTWALRRPTTLPARAGGKDVTVGQLLTLAAFLLDSDLVRRPR